MKASVPEYLTRQPSSYEERVALMERFFLSDDYTDEAYEAFFAIMQGSDGTSTGE